MRRAMLLITLLVLGVVTSAAAEPPPGAPQQAAPTGQAPARPGVKCEPVAGNPELEAQKRESEHPPSTEPNGEPAPKRTGASACPPGQIGVTEGTPGVPKHKTPFGPAVSDGPVAMAAATEVGYRYVGDEWSYAKSQGVIVAVETRLMRSGPSVPAGSAPGAHSVDQIALLGGATSAEGTPQYTLEQGWFKEAGENYPADTSEAFIAVNNGYYAEGHWCINCGVVLAAGYTQSQMPFGLHYWASDGTPGAKCADGSTGAACWTETPWQIKHQKQAWWIWEYGLGWFGYEPDSMWGGNFTHASGEATYGEVYDWTAGPKAQMGNGIAGNVASLPPNPAWIGAPKLDVKPPKVKSSWRQVQFHSSLMEAPPYYRAGHVEESRTGMSYGGTP
jgi:hypothetical protein